VLVGRLRKKIETDPKAPRLIQTSIGTGYKFAGTPQPVSEASGADSAETIARSVGPRPAERRQLTILRCGLAGTTTLAARLDPEALLRLIGAFQEQGASIIAGLGGEIVGRHGDGIVGCFGYPLADEYDAERAVWAGLRVVEMAGQLSLGLPTTVAVRVGIATGSVVVGNFLREGVLREPAIVGEASELAARLMSECEAGGVVISAGTQRLIGRLFEYRALPAAAAFQILGEGVTESRFDAMRDPGLTPFVGRQEEIALLLNRWQRTKAGAGRLVVVSGEPGIGKSRLVHELATRIRDEAPVTMSYLCSPLHAGSEYYPIIRQIERAAGFARADDAEQRLAKLQTLLRQSGTKDEGIALIADLICVPTGDGYPPPNLSPRQRRERTFQALLALIEASVTGGPTLIVFEDAHWIDPSSHEILNTLAERVIDLPVLLIVTSRPEFVSAWPNRIHAETLVLNPLEDDEIADLVAALGDTTLSAEFSSRIVERADGIPLFAEELTKTALERGSSSELSLPESLHDLLMARLDRVPAAREVAQIAAVVGRSFSYELLAALIEQPEPKLNRALGQLVASGLASRHGVASQATYTFKHALIQNAAYESLPANYRTSIHERIVAALLKEESAVGDVRPDLLAYHAERAELAEQAIEYYTRAGWQSFERAAYAEARHQFGNAMRLTAMLPVDDCDRFELRALRGLYVTARWSSGYASTEAGKIAAREVHLCEQLGFPPIFAASGFGLWTYYLVRSDLTNARNVAERLLRWGEERGNARGRMTGHFCTGWTHAACGELSSAQSHLEHALEVYDLCTRDPTDAWYHQGTRGRWRPRRSNLLGLLGHVVSWAGQVGAALAYLSAVAEAGQDEGYDEGYMGARPEAQLLRIRALSWLCAPSELAGPAEALIALSREHGLPLQGAVARAVKGYAIASHSDSDAGIAVIREGLAGYEATGAVFAGCWLRAMLAETLQMAERADEALHILITSLEETERTGETWYLAELHRRIGEAHRQRGDDQRAVQCFEQALAIASGQGAKLWELQAATSYARLLRDQDRPSEAHALLAPVYACFTEGLNTVPLSAAKALLDELEIAA
jgi:class 3 adenylate cyclase/tetratricopeptide (TPR) repeat protein